jgi:hypothetical protein
MPESNEEIQDSFDGNIFETATKPTLHYCGYVNKYLFLSPITTTTTATTIPF